MLSLISIERDVMDLEPSYRNEPQATMGMPQKGL